MPIKLPCNLEDPVLKVLRGILKANVIRVPDRRYEPLKVIEKLKDSAKFRGELAQILTLPNNFELNEDDFDTKRMGSISGQETRSVDFGLGITILQGFLSGFGVSIPHIETHFQGVKKLAFSFENVNRVFIDNGLLGNYLKSPQKIDKRNPSASRYFIHERSSLLVIDSVITSDFFDLRVKEQNQANFNIDIETIQKTLGNLKVPISASKSSEFSISFEGNEALPFAFTCVRLELSDEGDILTMPPEQHIPPVYGSEESEYEKTLLSEELELLDMEFDNSNI